MAQGFRMVHCIAYGKARQWKQLTLWWQAHEATGRIIAVVTDVRNLPRGLLFGVLGPQLLGLFKGF